jgi:hypothetical protein
MADAEIRFPETYVSGVPIWARRRKRQSGLAGALLRVIIVLLALFGGMVLGVSLRMGSVAKGGAVIDRWIAEGQLQWNQALEQAREGRKS